MMHTFADKLQTVANWVVATGTNKKRQKTIYDLNYELDAGPVQNYELVTV